MSPKWTFFLWKKKIDKAKDNKHITMKNKVLLNRDFTGEKL